MLGIYVHFGGCLLPTLRKFLILPETLCKLLFPRLLWNVARLSSSSGRGVGLLELVVKGRVAYMLPQAILTPNGLAARTFCPVAAFDCINSLVEGQSRWCCCRAVSVVRGGCAIAASTRLSLKGNPTWPSRLSQLRENNPFKSAAGRYRPRAAQLSEA